MELRHLILIDEQSQKDRLERIRKSLEGDGIHLIYEEINPNDCSIRQGNGDLKFDKDILKEKLRSISFLSHLDIFATDYNLIDDELKGIDLIAMLYDLLPYYRNQVVMYSAQIKDVINDIIIKRAVEFEQQVKMLKLLAQNEINYLSSEGEFETNFKKLIVKEHDMTIDARLADSLRAIDNKKFKCSIPGYSDKKISEIGELLLSKDTKTVALKKSITEHIIANITAIDSYE